MNSLLSSDTFIRMCIVVIAAVLGIAALRVGETILAPVALALVLGVVASPLLDRLQRVGVPPAGSAFLLLLMTTAGVLAIVLALGPLIVALSQKVPEFLSAARAWIESLSDILRGLEDVSREIEETVGADGEDEAASSVPNVTDALWFAPNVGAGIMIFMGTFFFFVLSRDRLYEKAGRLSKSLYTADGLVARYFAAITIVNAAVGVATAAVMALIGLENPLLWGVAAGLLNYILYLGPMIMMAGLLFAGMVEFFGPFAFIPPFAFFLINLTEAQFVTPWFVGQQVRLNPLIVFLAIVFGLWLWGPVGAIVVLPIILWTSLIMRKTMIEEGKEVRKEKGALV